MLPSPSLEFFHSGKLAVINKSTSDSIFNFSDHVKIGDQAAEHFIGTLRLHVKGFPSHTYRLT